MTDSEARVGGHAVENATQHRSRRSVGQLWLDAPLQRKGLVVVLLPMLVIVPTIAGSITIGTSQSEVRQRAGASSALSSEVDNLLQGLNSSETAVLAYAATGDETLLAPYVDAAAGFDDAIDAATTASDDSDLDESDGAAVDSIVQRSQELNTWLDDAVTSMKAGDPTADEVGDLLLAGTASAEMFRRDVEALKDELEQRVVDGRERNAAGQRSLRALLVAALVLSVTAAAAGMLLLTNGIVRRINEVRENARRLSAGGDVRHVDTSFDEIGMMVGDLKDASALLADQNTALQVSRDRALEATRAKDEFLSRVSHELRTPLTAILGFGGLLQMEELADDDQDSVGHIVNAGRHLLELINDLIDVSLVEGGNLSLSMEPMPLRELLEETKALLGPLASDGGVTMLPVTLRQDPMHDGSTSGCEAVDLIVRSDRQRLKQVLLNLVSNAVKYNVVGGSVAITAIDDGDRVRVEVSDTGRGLTEESLQRLFQPFERLDAAANGVTGTGIGLVLSKSLVEAMGGTIGARSVPGEGSTFWVEISRVEPTEVDIPEVEPSDLRSPTSRTSATDDPVVLYVEDNPASVALLQAVFNNRREHLHVVGQGRLATELAASVHPRLVMLDQHLPDIDGEGVLLALKADSRTRDIPVVIVSASASPGRQRRMLELGAHSFLAKPLDVAHVVELLDDLLHSAH